MPVVSTNTSALAAVRYLNENSAAQSSALSKLASGKKNVAASDDAAGQAIATRIASDVSTLQQAASNASQANAVLEIANGGATNIGDILIRMKTLASESASGTVTDDNRNFIDSEFQDLKGEIDDIAKGTRFGDQSLLDGTSQFSPQAATGSTAATTGAAVLVGSNASDTITISIATLTTAALGLAGTAGTGNGAGTPGTAVDTQANASAALSTIDAAIQTVSAASASLGAQESQFNFSSDSISTQTQNLQAAHSAISDVDVAAEEATLSSAQVLVQTAVAAQTAADQMPQTLLKLLG